MTTNNTSWLADVLAITFLDLEGVDVLTPMRTIAKKAKNVQGLTLGSIPIYAASTDATQTPTLSSLMSHGTKFWDAIIYCVLKGRNFRIGAADYEGVFVIEVGTEEAVDITSIPKIAMSMILLWLTRGSFAERNNTNPLPRMVKSILGFEVTNTTSEGALMAMHSSFDLRLINLSGIFQVDPADLGFDPTYVQRIKLSIAGHKPLKVVADNWAMLSGSLPTNPDTSMSGKMASLVILLKEKSDLGLTYKNLHPSTVNNIAQKYPGFYKTCLHAIVSVMSNHQKAQFQDALDIVNSRRMFLQDNFMNGKDGQPAQIVNYQTTVGSWNLVTLASDFGTPWMSNQ
jgi:hypothetical protein